MPVRITGPGPLSIPSAKRLLGSARARPCSKRVNPAARVACGVLQVGGIQIQSSWSDRSVGRDQYGFTLHPREPSFQVSSCCVRGKEDERPCGYCLLAGTNAKPSSVNIGVVARSNNNVIDVPMRNAFNLHSCFTHYQEEEHHAYASSKIHSTGTQKCPFSFPQNFLEFTNTTACIHYIQYRPTPFPPFLPLRCTSNYPPYPTGKQIK
jgi:hypothetical protein